MSSSATDRALWRAARHDGAARAVLADALEARGDLESATAVRAFVEPRSLGDLDLRGDYAESIRVMSPRMLVVANLAEASPASLASPIQPHLTIPAQADDLGAAVSWVRGRRVFGRGPPLAEALEGLSEASRAQWDAVRWLVEHTPSVGVDLATFTIEELRAAENARTLRERLLAYLPHQDGWDPHFGVLVPHELGVDDDRRVIEALLDVAAKLLCPVIVGVLTPPPAWAHDAKLRGHPGARYLVLVGGRVTPRTAEGEAAPVSGAYAVAASVASSWVTAGGGLAELPGVPATLDPLELEENIRWRSRGINTLVAEPSGCRPFAPVTFAEGPEPLPCVVARSRLLLDLHRVRMEVWGRALTRGTAEEVATGLEQRLRRRYPRGGATIVLEQLRFVEAPGLTRGSYAAEPVDVTVKVTGPTGETISERIRSFVGPR